MRNALLVFITALILSSCSYFADIRGNFDESQVRYNNLFRWNELESASMFAADSVRKESIARTLAAKNVRIVDSRVIGTRYDAEKNKATVEVEVDYHFLSTARVKTLRDTQEWAYIEERGAKGWRLMSPLPEFK